MAPIYPLNATKQQKKGRAIDPSFSQHPYTSITCFAILSQSYLVVDVLGSDHADIVAVGCQSGDKALHGFIGDDERRIVAVGTYAEMVVVVRDEGMDGRILQGRGKGLGFGMGKNQAAKQW